jgi:dienelactone hydrolase
MANQLTINEMRVDLQLDEVTIEGHLAIPEHPHGIIVFAHGSGSSRHSRRNRFVARRLNESRLATLLFDLLTAEEHAKDQASGQFRFDIRLLARRLMAAVDALAKRPETATIKVGLLGASTGAAATLIAAAEHTNEIGAVVSRCGRADLASESLPEVVAPMLLIVGGMDHGGIELNQRAYEQLKAEKQLEIVEGATHLFEEPGALDTVADLATRWFDGHLKPHSGKSLPGSELDSAKERDRTKDMELLNKREMIQAIIDEEPEPWIIMKPSRNDPADPESLCIFENPSEHTQARAPIPLAWFEGRQSEKIKEAIRHSLRHAQVMYKSQ